MSLCENIAKGFAKVAQKFNDLATVAKTGSYSDLTDTPDLSQVVRCDQANILTAENTNFVSRQDTNSGLSLRSAPSGYGACLDLCGNDVSGAYSGVWQLSTVLNGTTYNLRGGKDGSLTFRGSNIVRSVNNATADINGNVTITIPTKTSDLTNDKGFLTEHQSLANYATTSSVNDSLALKADKSSLASVATSGKYSDLQDKPTLSSVATSGSYNDLSDKPAFLTYDDFYPVGSVYLTKDASFNPSTKFGGTWTNESGGYDQVIVWHRTA